ncbi:hypothetical protein JTB14_026703 [Gonioctena quinquepunctata]|nr:hypothetical protein JTB14_026703 [Gonioctena quinquepunctata]
MVGFKTIRTDVYETYMKKYGPSFSGENQQERSFITPHEKIRHEAKKVPPPPEITTSNRFTVLDTTENTETPVETHQIQEIHMETQDVASNFTSEAKNLLP